MTQNLIQCEAENVVGAEKGKHDPDRKTNFSGTRTRRLHTRMGILYLMIPKVRKGGYVPFCHRQKTIRTCPN